MQVNSCRAAQATMKSWRRTVGTFARLRAATAQEAEAADGREKIMIRGEGRIVAALGAVFVTLGGINAALAVCCSTRPP